MGWDAVNNITKEKDDNKPKAGSAPAETTELPLAHVGAAETIPGLNLTRHASAHAGKATVAGFLQLTGSDAQILAELDTQDLQREMVAKRLTLNKENVKEHSQNTSSQGWGRKSRKRSSSGSAWKREGKRKESDYPRREIPKSPAARPLTKINEEKLDETRRRLGVSSQPTNPHHFTGTTSRMSQRRRLPRSRTRDEAAMKRGRRRSIHDNVSAQDRRKKFET